MTAFFDTLKSLFADYGSKLGQAIVDHTLYVLVAVAIGFALGLLLGVLLSRVPRWSGVILPDISSTPFLRGVMPAVKIRPP